MALERLLRRSPFLVYPQSTKVSVNSAEPCDVRKKEDLEKLVQQISAKESYVDCLRAYLPTEFAMILLTHTFL